MFQYVLISCVLITSFSIVQVSGQVSIPFCCDLDDNGSNCNPARQGRGRDEFQHRPGKLIPYNLVQRLKISHLGNKISWRRRELDCSNTERRLLQAETVRNSSGSAWEFGADGMLLIRPEGDQLSGDYHDTSRYCINKVQDNAVEVKFCKPDCSSKNLCLRLCCPIGKIYAFPAEPGRGCIDPPTKEMIWRPPLYRNPADPKSLMSASVWNDLHPQLFLRPPQSWVMQACPADGPAQLGQINDRRFLEELEALLPHIQTRENRLIEPVNFRFDFEGRFRYRSAGRRWVVEKLNDYCLSGILYKGQREFKSNVTLMILCQTARLDDFVERQMSEYYGGLAIFASLLALATIIVYFLLFDKQNIHGWTIMSHSSAVFGLFVFIGSAHITNERVRIIGTRFCTFIGTGGHFFFIAAFTWLLILSVDLWLTFRNVSAPRARGGKGRKRFLVYCSVGWGFPILVVSISWILQLIYGDDEDSQVPVPNYGRYYCYIDRHFLWEFIYGPVAILILLNLSLFIWTAVTLYRFHRSTVIALKNINQERQSFLLFFKLFLVSGVTWILEPLGGLMLFPVAVTGAHVTWYISIMDSINILQPVAVFIIFVLKWDVINELHERYIPLRPIVYPVRSIFLYFRKKQTTRTPFTLRRDKVNETQVSRVSTMDEANSTL